MQNKESPPFGPGILTQSSSTLSFPEGAHREELRLDAPG